MARATVHDLKTLILSFQPVVAIDSVEEESVESLVREVAAELRLPLFQWSFGGAELEQAQGASLYRTLYEKRPLDPSLLLSMLRATVPLSVSRARRHRGFAGVRRRAVRAGHVKTL